MVGYGPDNDREYTHVAVPMRIVSVLAATGAGAAVGWVCGLVPMWPVARLIAASVFGALVGTARGLKEARRAGRLVEQVELFMATSAGENAGRFLITPEAADSLLNGTVPPARFFVANVQL